MKPLAIFVAVGSRAVVVVGEVVEEVGGDERDVGGRGLTGRRDAGRRVVVGDGEVARIDSVGKKAATGIVERRPTSVMGIEVAQQQAVAVGVGEDFVETRSVVRRT